MWDMYGLNAELGFLDTWWSQENKINSKRFSTLFLFSSSDSADLIESLVHSFAIILKFTIMFPGSYPVGIHGKSGC